MKKTEERNQAMYSDILKIGQRIHCILYGGKDGTVINIKGEQSPETCQSFGGVGVTGGNADLSIVWDNGTKSFVPESLVRSSVQWKVYPKIVSEDEIHKALENFETCEIQRQKNKENAAKERAEIIEKLKTDYSHLERVTPEKYNSRVIGAKNIRKELNQAFPGIKFTVRGDSFSGGDSIDISWTDGPTQTQVEKITTKYQEGSFDGMVDLYTYHYCPFNDLFGGAKYVQEHRTISKALWEYAGKLTWPQGYDENDWNYRSSVNRKLDEIDLTDKIEFLKFQYFTETGLIFDHIKEQCPDRKGL